MGFSGMSSSFDFKRCDYCKNRNRDDWCEDCFNKRDFEWDKQKLIEASRKLKMSIRDLVSLIELEP